MTTPEKVIWKSSNIGVLPYLFKDSDKVAIGKTHALLFSTADRFPSVSELKNLDSLAGLLDHARPRSIKKGFPLTITPTEGGWLATAGDGTKKEDKTLDGLITTIGNSFGFGRDKGGDFLPNGWKEIDSEAPHQLPQNLRIPAAAAQQANDGGKNVRLYALFDKTGQECELYAFSTNGVVMTRKPSDRHTPELAGLAIGLGIPIEGISPQRSAQKISTPEL